MLPKHDISHAAKLNMQPALLAAGRNNVNPTKENTMSNTTGISLDEKQMKRDMMISSALFNIRMAGDLEKEREILLELADLQDEIIRDLDEAAEMEIALCDNDASREVMTIVFANLKAEEQEFKRDFREDIHRLMDDLSA